jgi:putative multiple sugar transport system permease protein
MFPMWLILSVAALLIWGACGLFANLTARNLGGFSALVWEVIGAMIVGGVVLGWIAAAVLIIGVGAFPIVNNWINDPSRKPMSDFGVAASAFVAWNELRARGKRISYNMPVPPMVLVAAKLAALVIVINLFSYTLAVYAGMPIVGLILVGLVVVYSFVMNKTILGRHIYAVGGNEKAAMLSGVKTKATTFWVFVNMGVLSALAGMIFAARLNAATPRAGTMFELEAIAAAFIGGAAMSGGVGTVIGAIIGGLVMGVMRNGMSLVGVSIDWQQAILGLVLLFAVAFDVYNKNKSAS